MTPKLFRTTHAAKVRVVLEADGLAKAHDIQHALSRDPGLIVNSCSGPAGEVLSVGRHLAPCILVAGKGLCDDPDPIEFEATIDFGHSIKVLVQSAGPDDLERQHYLGRGCFGVVSEADPPSQVLKAVRSVSEGQLWIGRRLAAQMLGPYLHADLFQLTPREFQILDLIKQGCPNKEIGQRLFVSHQTVRWHLRCAYSKLGMHHRNELARLLFQQEEARLVQTMPGNGGHVTVALDAGRLSNPRQFQRALTGLAGFRTLWISDSPQGILNRCRLLLPCILVTGDNFLEEATRAEVSSLVALVAGLRVLVETDQVNKERILELLRLGCAGTLLPHRGARLIRKAIQAVESGEFWVKRLTISEILRAHLEAAICHRTPRESQIVELSGQGMSSIQIGERLGISPEAVRKHLHRMHNRFDQPAPALYNPRF